MKRLMLALLVVGATVTMIGMVTLANFSDTEESIGNTATAGTLNLLVGTGSNGPATCNSPEDDPPAEFTITNMAPGESEEQTPCLKNDGSIDASKATLEYTITADLDNGCSEPEIVAEPTCNSDTLGELDSNLDVDTWVDNGAGIGGVRCDNLKNGDETSVGALTGKLSDIHGGGPVELGVGVSAGAFICVGIELSVDGAVGNIIQSDSVTFTKTYVLTQ